MAVIPASDAKIVRPKGIIEASDEFKKDIDSIIANFSFSAVLKYFATYQAASLFVHSRVLYRTPKVSDHQSSFSIVPAYDDTHSEYGFAFFINESSFYRFVRESLTGKAISEEHPLTEEEEQMTSYDQVKEAFMRAYGEADGYVRCISALRTLIMHQLTSILLAHHWREQESLKKYDLTSIEGAKGHETEFELRVQQVLREWYHRVNTAFLKVGIEEYSKAFEPHLVAALREKFSTPKEPYTEDKIRKEFKHLYFFDHADLTMPGATELYNLFQERFKDYSADLAGFNPILSMLQNGTFISECHEGALSEISDQFVFKRLNEGCCPECGKTLNEEMQADNDFFNPRRLVKTPEECTCPFSTRKMASTTCQISGTSIQPGTSSSGKGVSVVHDAETGEILSVRPAGGGDQQAEEKLRSKCESTAGHLCEVDRQALEELNDTTLRSRGLGSMFGRSLRAIREEKFPWTVATASFVRTLPGLMEGRTWLKRDLAFRSAGIRMPATSRTIREEDQFSILLLLDASGSMSDTEVARGLGSIVSGASSKIQSLYLALHDGTLANLAESEVIRSDLMRFRTMIDWRIFEETGIVKFKLDNTTSMKESLLEALHVIARDTPAGGTSHVQTIERMHEIGFFNKYLKETLSGVLYFTDCASDLEEVPKIFDRVLLESRKPVLKPGQHVIVNVNRGQKYQHPEYWTICTDGRETPPLNTKTAKRAVTR